MKSKDYLALVDTAANLVTIHIPHMGYRVPQEQEQHSDTMQVDGTTSGAIDMLSPALRWNFDYALIDACHFLSMTFKKALQEGMDEPAEPDDDDEESAVIDDDEQEQIEELLNEEQE